MSAQLVLKPFLPLDGINTLCQWALHDVSGQRMSHGTHPLSEVHQTLLQNDQDGVQTSILLPGELALSFVISVNHKQAKYLQQTIAFHVEDHIAQDIDDLHIVLGEKLSAEQYRVTAIDKEIFESFYQLLGEHTPRMTLKGVYSEVDAIYQGEEAITIFLDETRALLKDKLGISMSVSPANLSSFIQTLEPQYELDSEEQAEDELNNPEESAIKVYVPQDQVDAYQMALAEMAQLSGFNVETETVYMSGFEMLSESYLRQDMTSSNLCRGEYAVQTRSAWSLGPWAAVASVAAIWFVLQIGLFIGKGFYFEQQANDYAVQAMTEYKKVFPSSRNANAQNLKRIIQGQLNSPSSVAAENDFLALLGEAGYQYSVSKGRQGIDFKSISFSRERGELTVEMRAKSFDQLDQLKSAIVAQGYEAKISSAVQEKDYFRGRISISAG